MQGRRAGRVFRTTALDAVPALSGPLLLAALLSAAVAWPGLSARGQLATLIAASAAFGLQLYAYHYQVHTPFFARESANRALEIVYSAGSGVPHGVYAFFHLRHHEPAFLAGQRATYASALGHAGLLTPTPYLNHLDVFQLKWLLWLPRLATYRRLAAAEGAPRASTYRWHRRRDDGAFPGGLGGVLAPPADVDECLWLGARRGYARQLVLESIGIVAFRVALCAAAPKFFFFVFAPWFFFISIARSYTDYVDHVGQDLADRRTNAVSCYGRAFNWLTFNSGYHLEHHVYASVHWARLPAYRARMLPAERRAVVRGAQWLSPLLPRRCDPGDGAAG